MAASSAIPFFGGPRDEAAAYDIIDFVVPNVGRVAFENTKITCAGEPTMKWDVKPAPGTDGASETDQGYVPAQVTITILIWNRALFESLRQLIAFAKVRPGKTRSVPLEILHPELELYSLRNFVIIGTPLLDNAGPQMRNAKFRCLEYFAKPKKKGTANPKANLSTLPTIFDGMPVPKPTKPSDSESGP